MMRKFFARATVNKSGNYVRLEQSRAQDFRCSSLPNHKIAESLSENSLSRRAGEGTSWDKL